MERIQSVTEIIITHLWDPIARRVNYFAKIGKNSDNLQNEVKELTASRDDLKMKVELAEHEGKIRTNVVKLWLENADEIIKNAVEMQEEFQSNKKCCYGWCLDCCSRYKLGKRIVKAIQEIQTYKEKKNSFGEIAVLPPQASVQELPTTTITDGSILDQVWNWLIMDAKTGIIGIWGKGGVGKTTLAKNINNKLRGTRYFEDVIFVTVSRDWNIKKLRNDIGKRFDLDLSKEEDATRASTSLFNNLTGKKFLLILDDMWERVDLEKLGVPAPKRNSGCKIIITTRKRVVCNGMETDKEVTVETLSDMKAWELFKEKAGNEIPSELESIARDVCKECQGLPLAIIVVGRALRKKTDRKVWEHARTILETSKFDLGDMQDEVYIPLKFSYDRLESDNLRNCFLYCSLFPEDYVIKVYDLIQYWTMEGFLKETDESLKRAFETGRYLLEQLVDSCLLESFTGRSVKMHDLIRDMAIRITTEGTERGRRFLVRAGVGLEECPEAEKWEGKDRISLMDNHIQFLPDEPKCIELSTLLLQQNEFLREIPRSFFKQMKNLRILDLSFTDVVSLPPSISELGSLQALFLNGCQSLKSVDHVGGLKQLQLLDLSHTGIVGLPHEIGQLTRLRRLNLTGTRHLVHIPVDVIVSLSRLKDLELVRNSFQSSGKIETLIKNNLGCLNHLSHFSANIPNDLCSSSELEELFLLLDKLKSFHLLSGDYSIFLDAPERRGHGMVEIVTEEVGNGVIALPKLKSISLRQLPALTRMWEGVLFLESLQEIKVRSCNSLRQLAINIEMTRALKVIKR